MTLRHHDSRTCFGIDFYDSISEAISAGDEVNRRGETYNGGWYDGLPCGRDSAFDFVDGDGTKLYAVTRQ